MENNKVSVPMYPVSSSQISYIGYDKDKQILYVTFNNGTTYQYQDVSVEIFEKLKNASSIGKYFNANIRDLFNSSKVK